MLHCCLRVGTDVACLAAEQTRPALTSLLAAGEQTRFPLTFAGPSNSFSFAAERIFDPCSMPSRTTCWMSSDENFVGATISFR